MKLLMTADAIGGVWTYATELASALAPHGVETTIALMGPASKGMVTSPVRPELVEGRAAGDANGARASTGSARTASDARISHLAGNIPPPTPDPSLSGREFTVIPTNLPLDWLADNPAPVRAAADAVAALAREVGADLVQLNSPALAVARFEAPVVAVEHGSIAPWWHAAHGTALPASFDWLADLIREGLLRADAVVTPSAAYAAEVATRYCLPRRPHAVHNGRRAAATPAASPATAAFTAGRLWDRVKRTDLLDRVAALTPIRAAGPLTAPHGESVAPAHLRTLGNLSPEALAAEYAAHPVFVSAASFEPFGLAVLEAAQAGCPLVLSDIATFRELWDGAALFVAGDDPADWAAAITRAHTHRDPLAEAARARAGRYTPEATAAAMMAVYAPLLAQAAAA